MARERRDRRAAAAAASPTGKSPGRGGGGGSENLRQGAKERRDLRTRYLAVKNVIHDEREFIGRKDSDTFKTIIDVVEDLHELVQKPREQVADAEALLDITNSLVTSVRSHGNEGLTPLDFINDLLSKFGDGDGGANGDISFSWKDVGLLVSREFRTFSGCCTMIGPMSNELKQRKISVRAKRTKPTCSSRPEELHNPEEGKTDTDKNMLTMFTTLRKNKSVRLENLILNRVSFAQTVENIFALSFLVKDGRAEITVNDSGHHLVAPKNAPPASAVTSGEASYGHFIFRFDFKDWQVMRDSVSVGKELMPHRAASSAPGTSVIEANPSIEEPPSGSAPSTPIRKLTRNRGLVIQEQSVGGDGSGGDDNDTKDIIASMENARRTRRWL